MWGFRFGSCDGGIILSDVVRKKSVYGSCMKRILDIILSAFMIIIISPFLLLLAIVVRIKLGSPALFRQERPGKDGKIFKLYKFRSMTDERNEKGELLPDEIRLTAFGKKLRSTSLDELPELFNILKGDMSFIGPRPLLVKYLPLYSERQRHRHDVRPGITGYAQVNGRNAITWEDKFEKDIWYVENLSFVTDMKVLFKTVAVVFKREGISSETATTMEEFKGSVSDERNE